MSRVKLNNNKKATNEAEVAFMENYTKGNCKKEAGIEEERLLFLKISNFHMKIPMYLEN